MNLRKCYEEIRHTKSLPKNAICSFQPISTKYFLRKNVRETRRDRLKATNS